MIIQDENRLKTWISQLVEDISDAEPDALAKYVIALVKKPLSDTELKNLCSEKLSVFLQSHTESFVAKLFSTLYSGDYLTSTDEKQKVKKEEHEDKEEEVITAETDELVLTDAESEQGSEPATYEKEESKKEKSQLKLKESSRSQTSTSKSQPNREEKPSRPNNKEDSRKLPQDSSRKPQNSPAPAPKPIRKRISPPRSTSVEKRAERARSPPPLRRRVIMGAGGGGGRVQNRHHRDTRRARSKSRERSRSPHIRKEKRSELDGRSMRRRCRDFHEKGFCMRGDSCPYDHGPDPVVVEDSALEKMVRSGGAVFDSTNAYGVNPPPPGMESTAGGNGKQLGGTGTVTEGYNPEAPALTTTSVTGIDFSVPPPPIPQLVQRAQIPAQLIYPPGTAPPPANILPPYSTASAGLVHIRPALTIGQEANLAMPVQTTTIYGQNPTGQITTFGGTGGMMMRAGRFKPYALGNRNPASRSLLVKKVPAELNKIAQLDQHFSKFGHVTNVQVQYEGRPDSALVTFKTRRDAMMAYKSTEPIFNNRFIKVFWQNDTQAQASEADGAGIGTAQAEGATTTTMGTELGPTIPLTTSTGPIITGPKVIPRYFTKTFNKPATLPTALQSPKKADEEPNSKAEEEDKTSPSEVPETSNAPPPNPNAPPLPAQQAQIRQVYGTRATPVKRRADKESIAKLMELQRMKTELYGKLVDQQKMLLHKLKNTEDKEQKKKLMDLLKKAEDPAKKTKAELEELGAKIREMQLRQTASPKKRRMNLVLRGGQSEENGQALTGNGVDKSLSPGTPNKKLFKLCRVVYVSNCPQEHCEKLIIHMEKFGDLFDYDINIEPRAFTYKNPVDAQRAVADAAGSFGLAKLGVEWAPMAKSVKNERPVIPDKERKPSEQMTPKDLLASLDYDDDDEEEAGGGKDGEESEAGDEVE